MVERTHSWLHRSRSILIHRAKNPANYLALLHFALAIITWRHALPGKVLWAFGPVFRRA